MREQHSGKIFDLVGRESEVISKHANRLAMRQQITCALAMVEDQRRDEPWQPRAFGTRNEHSEII